MQKELLDQLETPCIVIDMARAEENVIRMQAEADAAGCRLRPHIKTHKMSAFYQNAAGSRGCRHHLCKGLRGGGHGRWGSGGHFYRLPHGR